MQLLIGELPADRGRERHGSARPFGLSSPTSPCAVASSTVPQQESVCAVSVVGSVPGPDGGEPLPVHGTRDWIRATVPQSYCPSACRTSWLWDYSSGLIYSPPRPTLSVSRFDSNIIGSSSMINASSTGFLY